MNKNWELKTLDDVCENIFAGGDVPKKNFSKFETDIYNIPIFANGFKDKGLYGFTDIKKVVLPSITVSARGTIGYSEIRNEPFFPIVRLIVLLPDNDKINLEFLKYIIESMDFKKSGTSIPQLTIPMIKKYKALIPNNLTEQVEIVKILDKTFESIEKAKTNIEKNLQNTKDLFASRLNEIFSQKGDGWEERTLGEAYDVRDGTHDSPQYFEAGYPLITSKNLKNGKLTYEKIKFISENDYVNINKRSKVDIGDVLFAMIGTIGNPVVIIDEPNYAIKNVALFKIDILNNSFFLKYYLDSNFVIEKMKKESKGTTQQFVGLSYLRKFPILLPNLKKQEFVVEELDILSNETNQLENQYQQKLDNLEELKKSILEKAFSGELLK